MKKLLTVIILLIMTTLCVTNASAFQSKKVIEIGEVSSDIKESVKPLPEKDWTVCIYVRGTDLETNASCTTADILEMLAADIPNDVNVLLMTGGTKKWNPIELDKEAVEQGVIKDGA